MRQLKSTLAEERRNKTFELEESQKEKLDLQKRNDRLENELDEKIDQVRQMITEHEENGKEFADMEQTLKNEIVTQNRLIDLLKTQLDSTRTQNEDLKAEIVENKGSMDSLIVENTKAFVVK